MVQRETGNRAAAGKALSDELKTHTGGIGLAAPIPGGMMIPMNGWCSMFPAYGFGAAGWSQACFYYYNSYWQPFLANLYWTAAARLGDPERTVWVMPDSYVSRNPSYYAQNLWTLLAGGAQGLAYFIHSDPERPERLAALPTLRRAGALAKRHGRLLSELRPARTRAVLLTPFENLIPSREVWYQAVIPFSNLLLAGIDVDPVTPEQDWGNARTVLVLNVRLLRASAVRRLERFVADGGRVYIDAESAGVIPIRGGDGDPRNAGGNQDRRIRPAGHSAGHAANVRPGETDGGGVYDSGRDCTTVFRPARQPLLLVCRLYERSGFYPVSAGAPSEAGID